MFSMHGGILCARLAYFFWRRSDHEVGLGLWLCPVLGDFILWSSKHPHVPAGRWWSLKVNLCLYGMFFFKMRKATSLSRWELELSRGVIRKDISSLWDVFREGRVATAGVSSVVICKVFLPEQTGGSCAINAFLLVYLYAESSLTLKQR